MSQGSLIISDSAWSSLAGAWYHGYGLVMLGLLLVCLPELRGRQKQCISRESLQSYGVLSLVMSLLPLYGGATHRHYIDWPFVRQFSAATFYTGLVFACLSLDTAFGPIKLAMVVENLPQVPCIPHCMRRRPVERV